jgi:ketosteroid isomerase-like protein
LAKNVDNAEAREAPASCIYENRSLWLGGDSTFLELGTQHCSCISREGHDALLGTLPTQKYLQGPLEGEISHVDADGFRNAINRRDVDRLCRLMTDDHLFVDFRGAQYRGRETMRSGWLGYFSTVPDYTIEVQETVADGPVVIVVGMARGTYSPDGNLDPADRWSTPGAWRAVVANGDVAVWQVFADNEPIRQIMRRYGKETAQRFHQRRAHMLILRRRPASNPWV